MPSSDMKPKPTPAQIAAWRELWRYLLSDTRIEPVKPGVISIEQVKKSSGNINR